MIPLKAPYSVREISIGTDSFKLAIPDDVEILFDELLQKEETDISVKDEQIPYWAELWPSALALAEFILTNPELVRNKKVLEIGCGLALPGIVAGKFANEVLLTDYLPDPVAYANYNWSLNHPSVPSAELLDWRNPSVERYDVLLASDIAYESRAFIPLINNLNRMIKPGGMILLSEPKRRFAEAFFQQLSSEGYNLKVVEVMVKHLEKPTPINVFQISF